MRSVVLGILLEVDFWRNLVEVVLFSIGIKAFATYSKYPFLSHLGGVFFFEVCMYENS